MIKRTGYSEITIRYNGQNKRLKFHNGTSEKTRLRNYKVIQDAFNLDSIAEAQDIYVDQYSKRLVIGSNGVINKIDIKDRFKGDNSLLSNVYSVKAISDKNVIGTTRKKIFKNKKIMIAEEIDTKTIALPESLKFRVHVTTWVTNYYSETNLYVMPRDFDVGDDKIVINASHLFLDIYDYVKYGKDIKDEELKILNDAGLVKFNFNEAEKLIDEFPEVFDGIKDIEEGDINVYNNIGIMSSAPYNPKIYWKINYNNFLKDLITEYNVNGKEEKYMQTFKQVIYSQKQINKKYKNDANNYLYGNDNIDKEDIDRLNSIGYIFEKYTKFNNIDNEEDWLKYFMSLFPNGIYDVKQEIRQIKNSSGEIIDESIFKIITKDKIKVEKYEFIYDYDGRIFRLETTTENKISKMDDPKKEKREQEIENIIDDKKGVAPTISLFYKYEILSKNNNNVITYDDNILREKDENKWTKIPEFTNIQSFFTDSKEGCVITLIKNKFPKLYFNILNMCCNSYWDEYIDFNDVRDQYDNDFDTFFEEILQTRGMTISNFKKFCINNKIDLNLYTEKGIIYYNNFCDCKKKTGSLHCITYNNHIYYLAGGKPKRVLKNNSSNTIYIYNKLYNYFKHKKIILDLENKVYTLEEFKIIAINNKLKYNVYGIEGNKIISNKNSKHNFILIDNNIYPIHNYFKFDKKNKIVMIYADNNINNIFNNIIKKNILPYDIKLSCKSDSVYYFTYEGITHVENDEFFICYDLLKSLGKSLEEYFTENGIRKNRNYLDYIDNRIKLNSIPKLLKKILGVGNDESFIPEFKNFETKPYLYVNKDLIDSKIIHTMDKNKAYASYLYKLKYLIKFDYRYGNINKIKNNNIEIKDHNLYFADCDTPNQLFPNKKLYPGSHIRKSKKYITEKINIYAELECEKVENFYRIIIDILFKNIPEKIFKEIMVVMIGTFDKDFVKSNNPKLKSICTEEYSKSLSGFIQKIEGTNMVKVYETKNSYSYVKNRSPIATQIKDLCRYSLFKQIYKYNIGKDNIVQISTDAISYIGECINMEYDETTLMGWKKIPIKKISALPIKKNECDILNIKNENTNRRALHTGYAGCGKSYEIINNIIPKLIKNGIDFIITSPQHQSLEEFRFLGYKCEPTQTFELTKTLPKEDYIIIDEIGMVGNKGHDFLYALSKAGKSFDCFGDFNQLLPVGETKPLNGKHYLKYMFNEINHSKLNMRNDFPLSYYDKLFNEECDLIKQVKKHSCKKPEDAEIIICYRKETKIKYIGYMMGKLGFKTKFDKGVKLFCKTNDLFKDNNAFYNNKLLIVNNFEKNKNKHNGKDVYNVSFKDKKGKIISLNNMTYKKLDKYFKFAYCNNIHQIQSLSISSYYWAKEDDNFIDGRCAYTIISRIKTK